MEALVLDANFRSIAVVDTFDSFIWTDRYNKCGDFEIYGPVTSEMLNALTQDRYLWVKGSRNLMIIEQREIASDVDNYDKLTVTGRSLDSILERRIIWGQTVLSGSFQNGIKQLLTANVISPTIADRAIPNFIFEESTDSRITALTVEAQFYGENLLESIQKLCDDKKVGFEVVLNGSNQFVARLYFGTDRSYAQTTNPYVIFSPNYDNLITSDYVETNKTLKTASLVAGEGEGSARKMTSAGSGSGLSRRELFVDAGDISSTTDTGTLTDADYMAQLVQRGTSELAKNKATSTFEGKAEMFRSWMYGKDFYMGDIVQVATDHGITSTSRVIELIHSEDGSGTSVYPTFATV